MTKLFFKAGVSNLQTGSDDYQSIFFNKKSSFQFDFNNRAVMMSEQDSVQFATVLRKYPTYRDDPVKSSIKWLAGKREDDNAEGLWRVHDKLYNLKSFVKKHPGGSEWLEFTEGTDVTEAFECYHVSSKPILVLEKFYVRDASKPRNYKFTFEDEGFYRTLKRRVVQKLETINHTEVWKSKLYSDLVFVSLFLASIAAVKFETRLARVLSILIAGQAASWLNTISHNFSHQRNNWRMYTANFVLTGWRDWRVYHGISHHLYPNTFADFQISGYEPYMNWIPIRKKTPMTILLSYVVTPFAYAIHFHFWFSLRTLAFITTKSKKFDYDELLPLLLPLSMFLFGNPTFTWSNLGTIFIIWNCIISTGSFIYSIIALSTGHHDPKNVHEGDEFRSLDYGLYQMATTIERVEANWNLFMSLTYFGDHIMHHFFPALDHALLPQLQDTLVETCQEFKEDLRYYTMLDAIIGQFQQLARTKTTKVDKE